MGGKWVKGSEVTSGTRAKIVSETVAQPSQFLDKNGIAKMQDVCKLRIEGVNEVLNASLNRATINSLVDAFGSDSVAWQGHYLTVETEKVKIAGKTQFAFYLVPEGYVKQDDENDYTVIVKQEAKVETPPPAEGEIDPADIPF